ncbi:hypothetical protein C343_03914 [Cryptococcus neoformans C23]|nr:hypothetical protein C343_03914 [Cryptococcus neoformans var. grubii C23]
MILHERDPTRGRLRPKLIIPSGFASILLSELSTASQYIHTIYTYRFSHHTLLVHPFLQISTMTIPTAATIPGKKLRIALLGCGRMGQRHAVNLHKLITRAEVVAVADPSPIAAKWVEENLPGVAYYSTPDSIFSLPNIDAVVISTITSTHASLTIQAIERGIHVLLEKPISVDVEDSRPVVEAARKRKDVKVMIGFVRRFDAALNQLHTHLKSSALSSQSQPFLLKSTSCDPHDSTGFFISYAKSSGGIFMDCGIHDIDMSRWLLNVSSSGTKNQVARVLASGFLTLHPTLADQGDCDNALAIIEYTNNTSCTLHLSRTGMSGYESSVEVFGTGEKLLVDTPASNRVKISDASGRHVDSAPTYMDRYGEAFIHEAKAFVDCILDDLPPPTSADDAFQAALIAKALTHSFQSGKPVLFGEDGEPILD